MKLTIISFFLIVSFYAFGQTTFLKILGSTTYQGGGGYGINSAKLWHKDQLNVSYYSYRNEYTNYSQSYNSSGGLHRYNHPVDSLIPKYWARNYMTGPFNNEDGVIYSYQYGFNMWDSSNRTFTVKYDSNHSVIWKKDSLFLYSASSNPKFGTLARGKLSHGSGYGIMRLDSLGNISWTKNYESHFKVNISEEKISLFTERDRGYLVLNNNIDSIQIITIDKTGQFLKSKIIAGKKAISISKRNEKWILIEESTSNLSISSYDTLFNQIFKYDLKADNPIKYSQIHLAKDEIIVLLYNVVDPNTFNTEEIPEFRVIDYNGKYLRRKYFRYHNFSSYHIPQKNGPFYTIGFGKTSDNGFYMCTKWSNDRLPFIALIKTDSNFRVNDSIQTSVGTMHLNAWDSVLLKTGETNIISSSISEISIFPNPASNQIFLSGLESSNTSFNLYNIEGKLVLSGTLGPENNFSVSELNAGTYIMNLETAKGIIRKKILVE